VFRARPGGQAHLMDAAVAVIYLIAVAIVGAIAWREFGR
jgi:hypothetical protein